MPVSIVVVLSYFLDPTLLK